MVPAGALAESVHVLVWMIVPVIAGYLAWRWRLRNLEAGDRLARSNARWLGRVALIGFAAPLLALVLWRSPLPSGAKCWLPLVGLSVHVTGGLAGLLIARLLHAPRRDRGAYLLAGACSNVLTFGSIAIVLFLRDPSDPQAVRALGDMAVYRLLEAPYYFLFAWPFAAVVSAEREARVPWSVLARKTLLGPSMAPILGMACGLALNLSGLEPPRSTGDISTVLVRANVVLLGLSVGLGLRRAAPMRHLRACLAIAGIKFLVMPAAGIVLALSAGLEGQTVQVIAVCASMPVAFMANVGAVLFGLDEELVGSFWVFTTASMLIVVPWLSVLLQWVGAS